MRIVNLLGGGILLLCVAGCGGVRVEASAPLPDPDAPLPYIWRYADSLSGIDAYATQRFGSFPEGLRKAVTRHRIDFFATKTCAGSKADLQSYLFFEYRRQRSLGRKGSVAAPDAETERYIRGLIRELNRWSR